MIPFFRPLSSKWFLLAFLIVLISLPVIGQESVLSDLLPDAPLFAVVAPLTNDIVSGDVIFILKPLSPLTRAEVRSLSSPTFSAALSEENSYTASWSSLSEKNGSYTFQFEACDDVRCETISVDVVVDNSVVPDSSADTSVSPSLPSDINTPVPEPPSSSEPSPAAETPSSSIFVSPSNYFGVFRLNEKDSTDSIRSTGDAFEISPGTYSVSARFPSPRLSLYLNDVFLDSDNVLFHVDENVVQSFSIGSDVYDVHSSTELIIPYSFYLASLDFIGDSGQTTFACLDWSYSSRSCNSDWVTAPTPSFSSEFTSPSVVVGTASLRPSASSDPVPDVNVPPAVPIPPVPLFTVNSSNIPSSLSVIFPSADTAPFAWGSPPALPAGTYSFDISFISGDLQSIYIPDAALDRDTTLVDVNAVSLSQRFVHDSNFFVPTHSLALHFDLSSSAPVITLFNPLFESLFACTSWDASSSACSSSWIPFSAGNTFSPSSNADLVITFARPAVLISDENETLPSPSVSPFDPRLVNAVWALKKTHVNSRFFVAESSRSSLAPLSTLFSSVDVSLECDPTLSPPLPLVPNSPTLSTSSPVSDIETPSLISSLDANIPSPSADVLPLEISPFYNPSNILFFSNEWENALVVPEFSRQSEDSISCDGVSLSNVFEDKSPPAAAPNEVLLGDTRARAKQSLFVTNTTSSEQTRHVILRFTSPYAQLSTSAGSVRPSSVYQVLPSFGETSVFVNADDPSFEAVSQTSPYNSVLFFQDEKGLPVGRYDFSDLIQSNFNPDVVVHARNRESIIETIIPVTIPPGETVFLDPILDLAYDNNRSANWYGITRDYTTRTFNSVFNALVSEMSTPGVQFFDLDGNGYANDLIITSVLADVNAKADVGAVWMILDVDKRNGTLDLNNPTHFTARWNGSRASDAIGLPTSEGNLVKVANLDGNVRANDLLIGASMADGQKADVGILYMIKDIASRRGVFDLNGSANFSASWEGFTLSDFFPNSFSSGDPLKVVNIDNNAVANDLLITSAAFDATRSENGAVFIIKDANNYTGVNKLNVATSYSLQIIGSQIRDRLGMIELSREGVFLLNLDNNTYANDLVIGASYGDANDKNVGLLYMILDVDKKSGTLDLNTLSNANARWSATTVLDQLGFAQGSGRSVFFINADGNAGSNNNGINDMIVACYLCNAGGTDRGAIYYVADINSKTGDLNFNAATSYVNRWVGATNTDEITFTNGSGDGILIGDYDGNGLANDMIVVSSLHNSISPDPARTDNGAVYLIRDFNRSKGNVILNNTRGTNFDAVWFGSRASDFLGDLNYSGESVQVVNLDGNLVANDLIIGSSRADTKRNESGAVWLIKDINTRVGTFDLNGPGKGTGSDNNYDVVWQGTDGNRFIGHTNNSGKGIQVVNVDNDMYANDLLLTSIFADFNNHYRAGGVFLIKDIDNLTGIKDLNVISGYNITWFGAYPSNRLGDINRGQQGVKVVDLDNNGYTNDILIASSNIDGNAANQGSLNIILDIDTIPDGNYDLNVPAFFYKKFRGSTVQDELTSSPDSNETTAAIDVDNNGYTNDIWISGSLFDTNGRVDAGSLFLIKDVASAYSVSALPPDVNVWRIDSYPDNGDFPVFNYNTDGNLTIDFNVFDSDTNSLLVDINYSTSSAPNTGTVIVDDVNISRLPSSGAWFCNDTAFTNVTPCGIDWNIMSVADNNYYIHITIIDSTDLVDQNTSDNSIGIANAEVSPDYSFVLYLPSSGCTNGKGNITGGTSCQRAWFEATDLNGTADQNQIEPEGQNAGSAIAFFSYDNTSSTSDDINIILDLNANFPASLILKTSRVSTGYQGNCTGTIIGCKKLSLVSQHVGTAAYTAGSYDMNVYFWGDFLGATAGRTDRNLNSTSGSPT